MNLLWLAALFGARGAAGTASYVVAGPIRPAAPRAVLSPSDPRAVLSPIDEAT